MSDGLKLEFKSGKTFQRYLKKLQTQGRGIGDISPIIAEEMRAMVLDIYEAEGPGWEPLAEITQALRRPAEKHKILQDTGVMVGSTEAFSDAKAAGVRSESPYLIFHVQGTSKMKKRDPFAIDWGKLLDRADQIIIEEVKAGLG